MAPALGAPAIQSEEQQVQIEVLQRWQAARSVDSGHHAGKAPAHPPT